MESNIITLKVYNSQTSELNLMSDEINYSTQISSKKHAANKTTTKFFTSCQLKAAVAYECNPLEDISHCDCKDLGLVPSRGELFLVVSFFNCQTTIHEDQGSTPCSGELFGF